MGNDDDNDDIYANNGGCPPPPLLAHTYLHRNKRIGYSITKEFLFLWCLFALQLERAAFLFLTLYYQLFFLIVPIPLPEKDILIRSNNLLDNLKNLLKWALFLHPHPPHLPDNTHRHTHFRRKEHHFLLLHSEKLWRISSTKEHRYIISALACP